MTTCTHPADKASTEGLLLTCPDCDAECSEYSIGDDGLCYDLECPLHAREGEVPSPVYGAEEVRAHIEMCLQADLEPTEEGMVRVETQGLGLATGGALCNATERAVRAAWAAHADAIRAE